MGEPYGRASLRPTLARTGITQFRFSMPRLGPLLLLDLSDDALLAHIYAINAQVKGEYGWPRMLKMKLLARGVRVCKERQKACGVR